MMSSFHIDWWTCADLTKLWYIQAISPLLNEWYWIAYRNAISYFGMLQGCPFLGAVENRKHVDDFGQEFHHFRSCEQGPLWL